MSLRTGWRGCEDGAVRLGTGLVVSFFGTGKCSPWIALRTSWLQRKLTAAQSLWTRCPLAATACRQPLTHSLAVRVVVPPVGSGSLWNAQTSIAHGAADSYNTGTLSRSCCRCATPPRLKI